MHLFDTGPCYCEYKNADVSKNGVKCFRTKSFERFSYCSTDEYCVGPDNPHDAALFSRDTFCRKGGLCFHKPIVVILQTTEFY